MTERSRAALYQGLSRIIEDEEVVSEVVTHISFDHSAGLATREQVHREAAAIRAEIVAAVEPLASRELVHGEAAAIRAEIAAAVEPLASREFVRAEISTAVAPLATREFVRAEVAAAVEPLATREFVRAEVAELRADVGALSNRLVIWMVGYGTTLTALVLAATRFG